MGRSRRGHATQSVVPWESRSVHGTRVSLEPGPGWGLWALWPSGCSRPPTAGKVGPHLCAGQRGEGAECSLHRDTVAFQCGVLGWEVPFPAYHYHLRVRVLSSAQTRRTGRRLWAHPGPTPFPRGTWPALTHGLVTGSRLRPPRSPDPFPSQDHSGWAQGPIGWISLLPGHVFPSSMAGLPLGL